MLVNPSISSPAPSALSGTDFGVKDDVLDALVGLGESAKLISNIGHEVGLRLSRDISIQVNRSNDPSLCIRYMVASTSCKMTGIGDPTITRPIAIWERVIELFSELLTGLT